MQIIESLLHKIIFCSNVLLKKMDSAREKKNDGIFQNRELIANEYLKGRGIEIGALHNPLSVPEVAHVQYVDRMKVSELKKQYPELEKLDLVNVDIVDDGEKLNTINDCSQDFVIANHFIEHCEDPISAIINMYRVLRSGGNIFLAIPDKRYTFDRGRSETSFEHLLNDYKDGTNLSRKKHFEEWVTNWNQIVNKNEIEERIKELMEMNYSIHYHVWTSHSFLKFLLSLQKELSIGFDIISFTQNQEESIAILQKSKVTELYKQIAVEKQIPFPPKQTDKITYSIDQKTQNQCEFYIEGWAYDFSCKQEEILIGLKSQSIQLFYSTEMIDRPDVRAHLQISESYNTGFSAVINLKNFIKGEYELMILIRNGNSYRFCSTDVLITYE